ncbi:nucleotide-binding protein [Mycobacteroides abscessus]|uniref:nucleotide-binding protein n=1 Tax=Mycobacteroides abscessus TaxID=36809 RepID=UPI0013FD02D8|nr:hypothetical protein [Mycobacteroides abscessus]
MAADTAASTPAAAPRRGNFRRAVEGVQVAAQQPAPESVSSMPAAGQYNGPAPLHAAGQSVRHSLIDARTKEQAVVAQVGLRGFFNQFGMALSPGKKEEARLAVKHRIRAPKDDLQAIAILMLKGGAGKTTVTATLGQVFSEVRSDGVVAVDANPSSPNELPLRTATHEKNLSKEDMLESRDLSKRDFVQNYMSLTEHNLNVLANGWRPDAEQIFSEGDIEDIRRVVSQYYSLLLWDGGTDFFSPTVKEVLAQSDALVLLVEVSVLGANAAGAAIDWLRAKGMSKLLTRTILVGNESSPTPPVTWEELKPILAPQQIKMHHIPFDKHLHEGLAVDLKKLNKRTLEAVEDLAALLADDFQIPQPAQMAS